MNIGGLIIATGSAATTQTTAGRGPADDDRTVAQPSDLRDRPVLQCLIDVHCAVLELGRVLVVLGVNADAIVRSLQLGRAEAAVCIDWDAGMAASLKLGMHALREMDRVIVTLAVDQLADEAPLDAGIISRLVDAPSGTRAAYEGRPGYPLALGGEHRSAIDGLTGEEEVMNLFGDTRLIECGRRVMTDRSASA